MTNSVANSAPSEFIAVISGSRGITRQDHVWAALDAELVDLMLAGHERVLFRLGDATGVDMLALRWARERGVRRKIFFADPRGYNAQAATAGVQASYVPELQLAAEESGVLASDWDRDGKRAGPMRNAAMIGILEETYRPLADLCVAIWDGASRGTRNCMATARNARVPIHQYGGGGPIVFKSPSELDDVLVEYRGELG